jgi:hypothetical protein
MNKRTCSKLGIGEFSGLAVVWLTQILALRSVSPILVSASQLQPRFLLGKLVRWRVFRELTHNIRPDPAFSGDSEVLAELLKGTGVKMAVEKQAIRPRQEVATSAR